MRELTGHKVNPANDKLTVLVHDEPGQGGAHHCYSIDVPADEERNRPVTRYGIDFQNGPIAEFGVNGLTHEALLSILIDRLECFQAGPFASFYNADALAALQAAQGSLQARTRARMSRGVEGTNAK